jgi:DNA polymerase I-like protein with 3'-5' exonuclease and polymerase domains
MKYKVVRDQISLPEIAQKVEQAEVIGIDLECTSFKPWHGEIRLIQLNIDGDLWVIDLFETKTLEPVDTALKNSKAIKVLQNAKFDQKWLLLKYGIELWPVFDTFRASAMIHNGRDFSHDIYSICRRELSVEPPVDTDLGASNWKGPLSKRQLDYSAWDVIHLLDLRTVLKKGLQQNGLLKVALFEFGAILAEASMELNGFRLDPEKWSKLAKKTEAEALELGRKLRMEMPHPKGQLPFPGMEVDVNLNSHQQMKQVFKRMGVDVPDTQEMTLALVAADYPLIQDFMKYRKLSKRLSAFGPNYLAHIDPFTLRIHPDYYPMLKSGRYSSSDPNLQQIPRLKDYRLCFCVLPGRKNVGADYSQIELRFLAEMSGDKVLRKVYKEGGDVHRQTAAIVCSVAPSKVTSEQRQDAKPVNFGFSFGMGVEKFILYALANYGIHFSERKATTFKNKFFKTYTGVKEWHKKTIAAGQRTQMSRTIAGRLRYLEGEQFFNEFLNHPIQGGNADGMKASLPKVYQGLKKLNGGTPPVFQLGAKSGIVHIVHDEIITETEDSPEMTKAVEGVIHDGMMEGMTPLLKHVPVVVEGGTGDSWATAKG